MELKKIKQKAKDLFEIMIDEEIIQVPADIIIKYNLFSLKKIDSSVYKSIKKDLIFFENLKKTLTFVEKKYRSQYEIENYCNKENIFDKSVLKYLKDNNYVNDQIFTEMFVNDKINFTNDGYYKILKSLDDHQIDKEIVENVFKKIDLTVFEEKLFKIIEKKLKQNRKYSKLVISSNVLNYCSEMGYERVKILELINQLYQVDEDIIVNEIEKVKKNLSKKYKNEQLEKQLIRKLLQKGFTYEEIKNVI